MSTLLGYALVAKVQFHTRFMATRTLISGEFTVACNDVSVIGVTPQVSPHVASQEASVSQRQWTGN